jgi:hypothetical protein
VLTSLQALLRLAVLRRLGVFICALAPLVAVVNTASALEPAQTKTRVWGFDFAADNSAGLFRAASSGKHRGNCAARAEEASGSLLAARGAAEATKLTIQFGKGANQVSHAFRHVDAIGLERAAVQSAVEKHLPTVVSQLQPGKPLNQIIEVAGQRLQYTAYLLKDGIINVGRIHPVP